MVTEKSTEAAVDEYTKDGTVDLHGNPVLRRKGGGWKACSFLVVYDIFERMSFYGIASNLVLYLTNELHQGTVNASNNVTNWIGAVWLLPIFGAYIADAYLGRYRTFIISAIIYLSGMSMLTLSVSIPSLKPPPCEDRNVNGNCINNASSLQLGVFFASLYIIALGTGGTKPNISTMGADQFDEFHPKEHAQKLSFFNWWMFASFFGTLIANTILVYIQDNVGWALGYGLPTMGLLISVLTFVIGTPFYRHKLTTGSPFTRMTQVIVASLRNWRVTLPKDPTELHELTTKDYEGNGNFRIAYTPSLNFLSKAAIKIDQSTSSWALCTVTQTEETKQMIRMIPILIANFIPSTMFHQANTLFIKQGTTLNRHMGPNFRIPAASLGAFITLSMLISVVLYDRVFVPFTRRFTGNPRGISLLQRMGIGCIIHTMIMFVASFTERYRLSVVEANGITEKNATVNLTIFVLLPQFVLMGIADAFMEVSKFEFFYDQAPEGMKSLGTSYATTSLSIGGFISSFVLKTTAKVTMRDGGKKGWILNNLNKSHLDYYYAFLAILSALNFCLFIVVSRSYVYKTEFVDDNKGVEAKKNNVDNNKEVGAKINNVDVSEE